LSLRRTRERLAGSTARRARAGLMRRRFTVSPRSLLCTSEQLDIRWSMSDSWRRATDRMTTTLKTRTVVLHDARRVEIPVEFWNYYRDLGLLIAYRRWPELGFLRHDLRAKVDLVNGGLRFRVKHLEPVIPGAGGCSLQGWVGEGEQGGWSRYDFLQRLYRAGMQKPTCKECGAGIPIDYFLATRVLICRSCQNKASAWKKILSQAGKSETAKELSSN
jgi:hypothetical protein